MTKTTDSDLTDPSRTAPGDGAADTTDPTLVAVSTPPQPSREAIATGTVNAVTMMPAPAPPPRDDSHDRFEDYEVQYPNGDIGMMRHNLETGVTIQLVEG